MLCWRGIKGRLIRKEPLKRHTTFKIGGPARFFIEPADIADLRATLGLLRKNKVPFRVIGAGSNILAADKGIKAAVICLSSQFFKRSEFTGDLLEAGAGVPLKEIVYSGCLKGLSGAEFLAGIPGTLGGALVMNAGIPGRGIGDLVEEVTVMDYSGRVKILKRRRIKFSYRQASLAKCIILGAKLRLKRGSALRIGREIKARLASRKKSQEYAYPSAGCVFKNPPHDSAGRLIDLCGLKGARRGGAVISSRHANFVLNTGRAKAADVLGLMRLARKEVQREFGILLQPEIKIWA